MEEVSRDQRDTLLTDTERQVLALVARGLTNKEIAAELYLSLNSVKSYMHAVFSKLKARNRAQAVILALNRGHLSVRDVFALDQIAELLASLNPGDFETMSMIVERKRRQH